MSKNEPLCFPVTIVEGKEWIVLKRLGRAITIRAGSIEKPRSVKEKPSGHRMNETDAYETDETDARSSVKITSKRDWDIINYRKKSNEEKKKSQ